MTRFVCCALIVFLAGGPPFAAAQDEPGSVASLVQRLSDDRFESRESAMHELGQSGLAAVPELTKVLFDADPETRWRAGKSLEQIGLLGDEQTLRKITRVMRYIGECGVAGLLERSSQMRELWLETQVQKVTSRLTELGASLDGNSIYMVDDGLLMSIPLVERSFASGRAAPDEDDTGTEPSIESEAEFADPSPEQIQETVAQIISDSDEADEAAMAEWNGPIVGTDAVPGLETLAVDGRLIDPDGIPSGSRYRSITLGPDFEGTDEDWKLLSRVSRLVQVRIIDRELTQEQWEALSRVTTLRSMYLERCKYEFDHALGFRQGRGNVAVRIVGRGFLGVVGPTNDLSEECRISQVLPGSAAESAGIQVDDVITSINGRSVSQFQDLIFVVGSFEPGDELKLVFEREGREQETSATLQPRVGLIP